MQKSKFKSQGIFFHYIHHLDIYQTTKNAAWMVILSHFISEINSPAVNWFSLSNTFFLQENNKCIYELEAKIIPLTEDNN